MLPTSGEKHEDSILINNPEINKPYEICQYCSCKCYYDTGEIMEIMNGLQELRVAIACNKCYHRGIREYITTCAVCGKKLRRAYEYHVKLEQTASDELKKRTLVYSCCSPNCKSQISTRMLLKKNVANSGNRWKVRK
jgi:hypothetical protein